MAEPDHPAHDLLQGRYADGRRNIATQLAAHTEDSEPPQAPGTPTEIDAEWAARILPAATDGLQLQWLLRPEIDMPADLATLYGVLMDALRRGRA
ncbi:hypothetical protein [Streptomyces sp. TLI_105]|uniref:hypothetical protein n=1 Tax=Streptomyces sp. TLI_105 TaxID=1881019 RepID=UPI000B866254|nr:hypothetical protein [Streptomyces sp. TLI_105]